MEFGVRQYNLIPILELLMCSPDVHSEIELIVIRREILLAFQKRYCLQFYASCGIFRS